MIMADSSRKGLAASPALLLPVQHVRSCYEAALPALSALTEAFPDVIWPEHVSEEAFLWASQLWYSYGMEVRKLPLLLMVTAGSTVCTAHHSHHGVRSLFDMS